jgi:pimeloyl-ACP methyl ester carboxylesterase
MNPLTAVRRLAPAACTTAAAIAVAVVGYPVAALTVPAATCTRPTIVMVHGAWADSSSWAGEVDRLQAAGYTARAIANPLRGLTSDTADVAAFLHTLSGPVVLVGHSYGGSVITNAAAGNRDIKQLVYVDAAAPAVGETTAQLSGAASALAAAPETLFERVPTTGDTSLYLKEKPFLRSFGPDLPTATATALWARQRATMTSAFMTPSAAAAWQTIPSWYLIGSADKIITPQSQTAMAHRAHSRIRTVPGGSHLTLISHPQAVTDEILAAAHATCPAS